MVWYGHIVFFGNFNNGKGSMGSVGLPQRRRVSVLYIPRRLDEDSMFVFTEKIYSPRSLKVLQNSLFNGSNPVDSDDDRQLLNCGFKVEVHSILT